MSKSYDAVVVGSGPNGLASAIKLAQNGLRVVILEAAESIGGGTRTIESTLPGFMHDQCSAVHPLAVLSPYLKTLPLSQHGLEWIYPPASVAHPLIGQDAVLQFKSIKETANNLGLDLKAWENLFNPFKNYGDSLFTDALKPLGIPQKPLSFINFGINAMLPATILKTLKFKEERARALFAGAAAHSIVPLDFMFSSSIGLMLLIAGHHINWPIAKGGSHNITSAMASYFRSLGGTIETSNRITDYNQLPNSKAYIFDTDPKQLVNIAGNQLPSNYKKRLLKFNYGAGVFKVDWALSQPIPWTDKRCLLASTVHVGGTFNEIAASERLMWNGKHSDIPFVLVCQQSQFDDSRAPKGKHTGYAYCHVPYGSTKDMTAIIENQIERFAPGFKDIILAKTSTNSKELHNYNPNLLGGAITGGANNMSQLFARPLLSFDPYSTPNKKIFICSASTPPGGGVHGMCGYWAAQSALRKLKF